MSADHYRTLVDRAEFRHKVERSEFLGIAVHAATEESFFLALHDAEKKYFDATHHCWAYRLFHGGDVRTRSSDAGEPSGTAGKPILFAIEGADVHDAGVIVVRWYGGIKLGTGGLARAYRDTAAETLAVAKLDDRYIYDRVRVTVPFAALSTAYRLVQPPDVLIVQENFGADANEFDFDVRHSRVDDFTRTLTEKRLAFRNL
jgi:uncharacterized YigZ family protein